MHDWLIVLLKIAAMFLVILVGWLARRKDYLTEETTRVLARFVVDLTLPALILPQMLHSVSFAALRENWIVPVAGVVSYLVFLGAGLLSRPCFSRGKERGTFVFLVGTPNWIYLPLPVAEALYGEAGVNAVLLFNVGATLALWTLGVWAIGGKFPNRQVLLDLARNPGLLATLAGIALALLIPGASDLEHLVPGQASPPQLAGQVLVQALVILGSLTMPLSLVMIGTQLGQLQLASRPASRLPLWGAVASRLLLAPAAWIALTAAASLAGWTIPPVPRLVILLIAAMPPAVSCSIFAERFGGDTALASRAIFYGTLCSIATVPALFYLVQRGGYGP